MYLSKSCDWRLLAKLLHGMALDLPDPLPGQTQALSDLLQGFLATFVEDPLPVEPLPEDEPAAPFVAEEPPPKEPAPKEPGR